MSETATTNYGFAKERLGHPPRDTALGENLDAIDTALKTVSDTVGDFGPLASAKIVVGDNGGTAAAVDMSGDLTIDNLGEVSIGAGKVSLAELAAVLLKGIVTLEMSFETALVTATKVFFPYKVTINKIRSIVMKEVAAENEGTITGANSTGDSNAGVVTVAAGAALNVEDSASPDSNNVVEANGYYQLTTAKATKGGTVLVTLEYTRTA
jgi:hypothetical protein